MLVQRILAEAMTQMPLEELRGLVYVRRREDFETILAVADHVLVDYVGAHRDRLRDTFRLNAGGTLEFIRHNPDDARDLRGRAWNFIAVEHDLDDVTRGLLRQRMKVARLAPPNPGTEICTDTVKLPELYNFTI